jgi:1-deoxy-D-xylulose-5-phosphate reductoisomerase
MGSKITIDSATLMNKGLEVIEARWLFDIDFSTGSRSWSIPRASFIRWWSYQDGAVMAQMGVPDMKGAIAYGLSLSPAACRWMSRHPTLPVSVS